MGGRRQFGSVRRLASGRWQASYWWEGSRHVAPRTFELRGGATRWLSVVEADLARGAWVDPRAVQVTLTDYSRQWLVSRTDLRPRTRELYASLLKLHIVPALGSHEIGRITPGAVRSWFAVLSGDDGPGRGASTAELMARMGHASTVAALRYQHATADRDWAIADALSSLGEQAMASVSELVPSQARTS